MDDEGFTLFSDDIFKAQYYILYSLSYSKKCEEYDPYGKKWYLNYTSIDEIANDYTFARVYESLDKLEARIVNRERELAYMLSYIAESSQEAEEAAKHHTQIISMSSHEERYNGYERYNNPSLTDIAWYFNEFHSSIGIMSMKIEDDKIYMNLDRDGRVMFQLKQNNGYLEYWRNSDKKGTLCTVTTWCAFEAVKWLLYKANHELPLRDYFSEYKR